MRHLLVCMAVYGAMSGAASAEPNPAVDWSGYYVAGLVGATDGVTIARTSVPRVGEYFVDTDFAQIEGLGHGRRAEWEPSGGVQLGYLGQRGAVVFGVEASADALFVDVSRTSRGEYLTAPGSNFRIEEEVEADWMASVRLRLGWAQGRGLIYVTAGPAVSRVTVRTDFLDDFESGGFTGAVGQSSAVKTVFGGVLGIGGEYALDEHWSISAQYLYADFGRVDAETSVVHPDDLSGVVETSGDLFTHTARVGVTYRFGGP